jgi:hypothetical protein
VTLPEEGIHLVELPLGFQKERNQAQTVQTQLSSSNGASLLDANLMKLGRKAILGYRSVIFWGEDLVLGQTGGAICFKKLLDGISGYQDKKSVIGTIKWSFKFDHRSSYKPLWF